MADAALHRHDLVRVDPAAWVAVLASRPELATIEVLIDWAEAGRPLVVRRRLQGDPDGQVALGLPLPPGCGTRRVAVTVDHAAILSVGRPPFLRAIAASAPSDWTPTVEALLRLGEAAGIEPRVFGSLAWAALTGLDYLRPESDLDLLWPIGWGQDVSGLLQGLRGIETAAPVRLDGEIVCPEGRGVNWRELASGAPEVLAKGLIGVELLPASRFTQARVAA